MSVSSDDHIYVAVRSKISGQFLILLESDMRQKNGQVNIRCLVSINDLAHLFRGITDVDQCTDQFFILCF